MVTLGDVERAIAARDPQLAALLVRYLAQDDPEPGYSELAPSADDDDEDATVIDVPVGAVTIERLAAAVSPSGLANQTATERKLTRRAAFAAAEASPFAPPRLRLGAILLELYERGEPDGRAALLQVFAEAKLAWGVWQAAKAIYKRAEERHDLAFYGVLAYRFDAMAVTPHERAEIGGGTLTYLRRRAWRFLRLLGQSAPDAYPAFAVEVLRHYPAAHSDRTLSWVAAQIWNRAALRGARSGVSFGLPTGPDPLQPRAFPQAWKLSPAPLLRLLEAAHNSTVCDWAIRCLRADHPLALRAVEPAWLARLGRRPVEAIHAFVVSLLRDSPELHQSKLRELGLHDVVVGFLRSPSAEARYYALDYAAGHAPDLPIDELVELIEAAVDSPRRDAAVPIGLAIAAVAKFAAARLEAKSPQELGARVLLRLLGVAAAPWAAGKLAQGVAPGEIDAGLFADTAARGVEPFNLLIKMFNDKQAAIPAGHWTALLDDPRFTSAGGSRLRAIAGVAFSELGKRSAREIGVAWIQ